jgi:predicted dehydrogenase
MEEAHFLVKLAHEARVQVQAGHPDWHSPAFRSSLIRIVQPQSIRIADSLPGGPPEESHRQVFKTILADLDLALGISGSSVRKVRPHASRMPDGTAFEVDIRVEMHNGSVVHLLIRKFADRPSRTIEIVQSDGIISIDLTAGTSHMEAYRVSESGPVITGKTLWPPAGDTGDHRQLVPHSEQEVARQCLSFIHALQRGRHPLSSLEGGFKALEITRQIEISLGTF